MAGYIGVSVGIINFHVWLSGSIRSSIERTKSNITSACLAVLRTSCTTTSNNVSRFLFGIPCSRNGRSRRDDGIGKRIWDDPRYSSFIHARRPREISRDPSLKESLKESRMPTLANHFSSTPCPPPSRLFHTRNINFHFQRTVFFFFFLFSMVKGRKSVKYSAVRKEMKFKFETLSSLDLKLVLFVRNKVYSRNFHSSEYLRLTLSVSESFHS